METIETDVAIIGSGFGGSVSALRLTEKGYDVTVVEGAHRHRHVRDRDGRNVCAPARRCDAG